jgi:hypothetical protein
MFHASRAPVALLTRFIAPPPEPEPIPPEPDPIAPPPLVKGLNPVATIVRAASRHSGYSAADIISHRHRADLVRVRHIVMYLAYRLTTYTFPGIGRFLDGRDHTTILHGVRKIERLIQSDERLSDDVAAIRDLAIGADPALGALA